MIEVMFADHTGCRRRRDIRQRDCCCK